MHAQAACKSFLKVILLILFSVSLLYPQGSSGASTPVAPPNPVNPSEVGRDQPTFPIPFIGVQMREAEGGGEVALGLQVIFLLAILTLAPSIIIMTTSFVRISIVLNFIQRALSLQQVPPRQIIMGLSLFLTFFIMMPTLQNLNETAIQPFTRGEMTAQDFYGEIEVPIREFMLKAMNTKRGMKSLDTFLYISEQGSISELTSGKTIKEIAENTEGLSTAVLIPSFLVNELTIAFEMGIWLFIPFIVIDLIVASSLMAMGMIMLPPVMVSLPLKLLLFISVDGWSLLVRQLVESYM